MQGTPRLTRRRALTTAAVGLLVVVVGQHPVGARPEGGEGVRHIEFTTSAPVLVGGDFGCDPTDAMRCAGTFRNVRTLTGDFAGTSYQVGAASHAHGLGDATHEQRVEHRHDGDEHQQQEGELLARAHPVAAAAAQAEEGERDRRGDHEDLDDDHQPLTFRSRVSTAMLTAFSTGWPFWTLYSV